MHSRQSNISISRSLFKGNTGFYNGGAIEVSLLAISESRFIGNKAGSAGGAISVSLESTVVLIQQNHFSHNTADYQGGAIYCADCTITITGNNSFESNTISYSSFSSKGGALLISYGHLVTSGTVVFSNNKAKEGGAVYLDEDSIALYSVGNSSCSPTTQQRMEEG